MTQVEQRHFSDSQAEVKDLIKQHLKLKNEPLLLAVRLTPDKLNQDISVVEIIDGFGGDLVDQDRELFEVTYNLESTLPNEPARKIHLVLTNPIEIEAALRQGWPSAKKIRNAVKQGRFEMLHQSKAKKASGLMELLRGK